jgi:predicted alpha/beta superfamily hydrolase
MKRINLIIVLILVLSTANKLFSQEFVESLKIGDKYKINSVINGDEYQISIHLPEGYNGAASERYPVVYVFFGYNSHLLFNTVCGITDEFSRTKLIPKMIVVQIHNIRWFRDLTFQEIKNKKNSGQAENFYNFLSGQLIPYIDDQYKTNSTNIYIGHSLSGLFGLSVFCKDLELFDKYILISPSIIDRDESVIEELKNVVINKNIGEKHLYITMGFENERIAASIFRITDVLNKNKNANIKWKFDYLERYNHFTLIPEALINGFLFLYSQ